MKRRPGTHVPACGCCGVTARLHIYNAAACAISCACARRTCMTAVGCSVAVRPERHRARRRDDRDSRGTTDDPTPRGARTNGPSRPTRRRPQTYVFADPSTALPLPSLCLSINRASATATFSTAAAAPACCDRAALGGASVQSIGGRHVNAPRVPVLEISDV